MRGTPKVAPNVLPIMTDDTGFGVSSTFGGVIPTPTLDRIAANDLRYTIEKLRLAQPNNKASERAAIKEAVVWPGVNARARRRPWSSRRVKC